MHAILVDFMVPPYVVANSVRRQADSSAEIFIAGSGKLHYNSPPDDL